MPRADWCLFSAARINISTNQVILVLFLKWAKIVACHLLTSAYHNGLHFRPMESRNSSNWRTCLDDGTLLTKSIWASPEYVNASADVSMLIPYWVPLDASVRSIIVHGVNELGWGFSRDLQVNCIPLGSKSAVGLKLKQHKLPRFRWGQLIGSSRLATSDLLHTCSSEGGKPLVGKASNQTVLGSVGRKGLRSVCALTSEVCFWTPFPSRVPPSTQVY